MGEENKNPNVLENFSAKISRATKEEIARIKEADGFATMGQLFDTLIENYSVPARVNKDNASKIEKLEGELDKLQDELSERESTIISQQNTISDHESTIDALNGQLESVSGENERLAGDVAGVEEMTRKNLLISDPELVEELKLIQKAVLLSSKKEKTINEIVASLLVACRQAGAFIIDKRLREKLKSMQ